jgi:hypothetical protein
VDLRRQATLSVAPRPGTKRWQATLLPLKKGGPAVDLGFPAVSVGASGKGDTTLLRELGVERRCGVKVDPDTLPRPGTRTMRYGADRLESQRFIVAGVADSFVPNGTFHIMIRKVGTPPQPVLEYKFNHLGTTSLALQLPRGMTPDSPAAERYFLSRFNAHLGTAYGTLTQLFGVRPVVWGNPFKSFVVEPSMLDQFVFGGNGATVGDFGGADSLASGLGAEIGATLDSVNIARLGADLKARARGKATGKLDGTVKRRHAFDAYNQAKAQSLELWSRGSRPFYLTSEGSAALSNALSARAKL